MSDLMASGANPGATYSISPPTDPGVYHEDRVVVTTVGITSITQMFRVYGATLEADGWHFVGSGVSTAYATVQNPDGSIHYFTYSGTTVPWPTSAWKGSDNNTIYNSVDYGLTAGGSTTGNNAALVSLFTALNTAPGLTGGFVRIPQYNFPVVGTTTGIAVPDQVIIQGLGTGGALLGSGFGPNYHFAINDSAGGVASAFLYINGPHTTGGVELRNVAFGWLSPVYVADTAVNLGIYGGLLYRCTFTDCPTAVNISGFTGTNDAIGSAMVQCNIYYTNGQPNDATAIVLAGQQNQVLGPSVFLQSGLSSGGPSGCTCITIGGGGKAGTAGNEHTVVSGIRFTDWTTCIDFADTNGAILQGSHSGCISPTISTCEMQGYGWGSSKPNIGCCINVATYDDNGSIYGLKITGNTMSKSQDSQTANPIVYIDTNGGANTNIQSVDLIGNLIFSGVTNAGTHSGKAQLNQYGVQINAGDSIRVIGGKIGNFGTPEGDDGTANICISGDPGEVIIDGVDLRPSYENVQGGTSGATASEYALLISGALTNASGAVRVSNCDMSGYSGNPVGVTGSVGSGALFITNCTGYNQSKFTVLIGGPSDAPTVGTSASTAGTLTGGRNFYGPSTIYFEVGSGGPVTLMINAALQTFPASSSQAISLSSPYDVIAFGSTTNLSLFRWIGA